MTSHNIPLRIRGTHGCPTTLYSIKVVTDMTEDSGMRRAFWKISEESNCKQSALVQKETGRELKVTVEAKISSCWL